MCQAFYIHARLLPSLHPYQMGMNDLHLQTRNVRYREGKELARDRTDVRSGAGIQSQMPDCRDHNYATLHDSPECSNSTGEANQVI